MSPETADRAAPWQRMGQRRYPAVACSLQTIVEAPLRAAGTPVYSAALSSRLHRAPRLIQA